MAQRRAQIKAVAREQAVVELAVRGKADSGAFVAERLRDRGDHADLAGAIGVTPALRDFAAVVGVELFQGKALADTLEHLARWNDIIHAPAIGAADIHE